MRAVRIHESTSGKEHPRVATIVNNLVEIYHTEGRDDEAEPLIARALKIHEQSLGSEHPSMAYSVRNLAENFFLRGIYIQAFANKIWVVTIRTPPQLTMILPGSMLF